jgi:hypothetical protein
MGLKETAAFLLLPALACPDGICRKFQFWVQNLKIRCCKFNGLRITKLSKKQICDRIAWGVGILGGTGVAICPSGWGMGARLSAVLTVVEQRDRPLPL